MATKLTIKSETNYKDVMESSTEVDTTLIESYIEGDSDSLKWHLEKFCKFLLGEGYSEEVVKKYLNYDGCEVFEMEEE